MSTAPIATPTGTTVAPPVDGAVTSAADAAADSAGQSAVDGAVEAVVDEVLGTPWTGPGARERQAILRRTRTLAMVGASADPARASNFVATYLLAESDYDIYFVNPRATEILGRPAYPDLAALPVVPDLVDVFRRQSELGSVLDDAIAVGARTFWCQLGLLDADVARRGEAAGLEVVMNRCVKIEHARFSGGLHLAGFDTGVVSARRDGGRRGTR